MICNVCEVDKDDESFSFMKRSINKRFKTCKSCRNEKEKQRYRDDPNKIISRTTKKKQEIRLDNTIKLMQYFKDNPCIDCGENDPLVLDFDHLDRDDKVTTISNLLFRSRFPWNSIRVQAEMSKCVVRCANCRRRKTAVELGFLKVQILESL